MSKKLLISVLLCFFVFFSFMPLNAQWARTYGGSGFDYVKSIQQTSDGGYIVAGWTWSFGAGERDIWILKLYSSGDVEWTRTYDVYGAYSIQQTSDGGYVVAAHGSMVLKLSTSGDIVSLERL